MENRRGLSESFINNLKSNMGIGLHRFLQVVKKDQTLILEIRENYINIYYRGGNLIKLTERNGRYLASFERKYICSPECIKVPSSIQKDQELATPDDVTVWVDSIPFMKYEMDQWFSSHPKNEREFQQLIVRENNSETTAKGTDYFICDIEYANSCGRFDLIAIYWPSTSAQRRNNKNVGLAFIEMKYYTQALQNESGLFDHILAMKEFYKKSDMTFSSLKEEMKRVFNQKLELGLINNQRIIESFNGEIPDFIIAIANYDPDSSILFTELEKVREIVPELPFSLKFAASNFMGYGLYKQNIYTFDDFMLRFEKQIYARN